MAWHGSVSWATPPLAVGKEVHLVCPTTMSYPHHSTTLIHCHSRSTHSFPRPPPLSSTPALLVPVTPHGPGIAVSQIWVTHDHLTLLRTDTKTCKLWTEMFGLGCRDSRTIICFFPLYVICRTILYVMHAIISEDVSAWFYELCISEIAVIQENHTEATESEYLVNTSNTSFHINESFVHMRQMLSRVGTLV